MRGYELSPPNSCSVTAAGQCVTGVNKEGEHGGASCGPRGGNVQQCVYISRRCTPLMCAVLGR